MDSDSSSREPPWKRLKLSLERPYKDDQNNPIPTLLDLTPEGQQIYEPKETPASRLESNLRKIFLERGIDFFDRKDGLLNTAESRNQDLATEADDGDSNHDPNDKSMTAEELFAMRTEIMPQLFVALGEMNHAQALLTSILTGSQRQPDDEPLPTSMSTMLVSKPPPIVSVEAFNAQLTIGAKDEALRKASTLFKTAADKMEKGLSRGEKYWVNALRIRRSNWGLTPAPLPPGSAIGKGADKTSKDCVVSFGLEGSPPHFRRRAIARLATDVDSADDLEFPFHQQTRLQITLTKSDKIATRSSFTYHTPVQSDQHDLDQTLKAAQTEIVDQEIFSILVMEAGNLPTAPARVSERLIVIEAAQGIDLSFALVDSSLLAQTKVNDDSSGNAAALIYRVLQALLIQQRSESQRAKLKESPVNSKTVPPILQPVIDILQYRVFCERVQVELLKAAKALTEAGIMSSLTFTAVGELGQEIVDIFNTPGKSVVGGEAILRIDDWHTIRFTFTSPSALTAHLAHATLTVTSLPQLSQLLMDEIERCLLQRIRSLGQELCREREGIWFVDLNRCVAKWEGCILNFQISYGTEFSVKCLAFRLGKGTGRQGSKQSYVAGDTPLLEWVAQMIKVSEVSQTS